MSRHEWVVFVLTVLAIILIATTVALINGADIAACERAGNSIETCYQAIKP